MAAGVAQFALRFLFLSSLVACKRQWLCLFGLQLDSANQWIVAALQINMVTRWNLDTLASGASGDFCVDRGSLLPLFFLPHFRRQQILFSVYSSVTSACVRCAQCRGKRNPGAPFSKRNEGEKRRNSVMCPRLTHIAQPLAWQYHVAPSLSTEEVRGHGCFP